MNTRILIIGATGNVGQEVINAFAEKELLRAAVRDIEQDPQRLRHKIECVYFDFEDPTTYPAAFDDVRALFLVRPPHISDVKKYIAPAVAAAKIAGVEHIVFLSIIGVEKNSFVPHHKIEKLIRESGMDWTFLRASFFMQNLNTTHRDEIKDRGEIAVPVGKSRTSFIDVRDIGAVAAKILSEDGHRNRAYDLTGSSSLDYFEVAATLSSVLCRAIRYTNPSILGFIRMQLAAGRPLPFTLIMTALYTLTRFGTADTVSPETAAILGRAPITFRQYVEDYRHYWTAS